MRKLSSALLAATFFAAAPAMAQESVDARIAHLEEEIQKLKLELAEQKQAQAAAAPTATPPPATAPAQNAATASVASTTPPEAHVEFGKGGFKLSSPDRKTTLKIGGYAQFDNRTFFSDDKDLNVDNFLVRRARPVIESTAGDFYFRLMPDFGNGATTLFDAYAEYRPWTELNFRVGKFKAPVGLDRLKSATDITFVERSMPTNLAPNRDIGVMLYGAPIPEISYELALLNGAPDLANIDSDGDDGKDVDVRLMTQPFVGADNFFKGLNVGVAGTIGDRDGSLTNREVGDYRTPSQARFFGYAANTFGDGTQWRLAPQGYLTHGPLGLLGEYTVSSQEVTNGAAHERIENHAWEAQASYVLTGEKASYKGWPVPKNPFDPKAGGWGAWELASRYGQLTVDKDAFPIFASLLTSARKAQNVGVALNGYLNDTIKLSFDYENTSFDGGAALGQDRDTEQVLLSRVNVKF